MIFQIETSKSIFRQRESTRLTSHNKSPLSHALILFNQWWQLSWYLGGMVCPTLKLPVIVVELMLMSRSAQLVQMIKCASQLFRVCTASQPVRFGGVQWRGKKLKELSLISQISQINRITIGWLLRAALQQRTHGMAWCGT